MELLLLRPLWLAKLALTIQVEKSRLAAEKSKKEKLAAVGVDVMETLVKYSKEEELVGARFQNWYCNTFLKRFTLQARNAQV